MNVTIVEKEPATEPRPQNILLAGKVVGELKPQSIGACKWHAVIQFGNSREMGALGLIQGFGETQESAIADAIERGIRAGEEHIRLTKELAASIGYQIQE